MKRFINAKETVVTEALDGLLLSAGRGRLARLDGYPHIKVILRQDWDKSKVAVISGGGSGHEPAHAGFVGGGMLTAAVCGEIFASPSVDAVLAAIQAVTGDAGCLLIVKNYTGDRLNFGLAAEQAKANGFDVDMVVVADDVAIPDASQRRGIAGTLFVHKVAGHAAESGRRLADVKQAAEEAARRIYSMGVSLSSCTLPGQARAERLGPTEAELGLGIHGEPGVEKIDVQAVSKIVAQMATRLSRNLPEGNQSCALLLNNLGSVPQIEMSIILAEIMQSELGKRIELVFGPAALMTALDMNGFSISLLLLDQATSTALLAPVAPAAWCPGVDVAPIKVVTTPKTQAGGAYPPSADQAMLARVTDVCQTLLDHEDDLNALDAKVGDGDTGSTFATAARQILSDLDQLPLAEPGKLCMALSAMLAGSMGGSSGVLLSILFAAMAREYASTRDWAKALDHGVTALQTYGGAKEGDRTMLDALCPASRSALDKGSLHDVAAAARDGAEATAAIETARAGRSSYLASSDLIGVKDPGAVAVALAFAALTSDRTDPDQG